MASDSLAGFDSIELGDILSDKSAVVNLLVQCNAEIGRLESELTRQRSLQATLKEALSPIRSHSSAASASVDCLPAEILHQIFAEIIQDNPLAIGPILLVCRRWNSLASNAASLWKKVTIVHSTDPAAVDRMTVYLGTAIKNSRPLPLDITLTLTSPDQLWEKIVTWFYPTLQGAETDWGLGRRRDDLFYWFRLRTLDDITSSDPFEMRLFHTNIFPPYKSLYKSIFRQIQTLRLLGKEDTNRIQSLTVQFDSSESERFYDVNTRDSLIFQHLDLHPQRLTAIDHNIYPEADWHYTFTPPNPNLTHLSWRSAADPNQMLLEPDQLSHLRILWNLRHASASTLRNLRQLFIDFSQSYVFLPRYNEDNRLDLLQLEDLGVISIAMSTVNVFAALNTPRLSTLRIFDYVSFKNLRESGSQVSEIGILGSSAESIRDASCQLGLHKISIRGYIFASDDFWRWDELKEVGITL